MAPLHLACIAGNITLVELLLAHGANPLARGQHEKIPLQIACRHGHEDIVTLLLDEKSSHMVDAGENTLLHYACSSGDSSLMKRVLQAGVSPNKVNVLGETPLHWAVEDNLQELIVLLLDAGANLSHKNNKHETALDIAFSTEHNSAVGVLLRAACQQNIPVKDVMSPKTRDRLRKYAFAHPPEIVKYLKNRAPDVGLFTPAAIDEGFPAYPTQTGNETKINLKS